MTKLLTAGVLLFSAIQAEVIELNNENFMDIVLDDSNKTKDGDWFIAMYKDNCPHCEVFLPSWFELDKEL